MLSEGDMDKALIKTKKLLEKQKVEIQKQYDYYDAKALEFEKLAEEIGMIITDINESISRIDSILLKSFTLVMMVFLSSSKSEQISHYFS